ncbi:MAG: 3-isopropylmalate dehydrogenase [Planctomycetes bacterium]|nr:3-isopropylmalate dehydrogenase [Planctomycetota bacterium]
MFHRLVPHPPSGNSLTYRSLLQSAARFVRLYSFRPRKCEVYVVSKTAGKKLNIAVIPGDGTGPEVVAEGLKVLKAVAALESFTYETKNFDFGGDRYLKTGDVLPAGAVDELRKFDAIFLGAVGHPDVPPGVLEKGLLLELRFQLDQYINLRPVKLLPGVETPLSGKGPADIDFVVVRENTEDMYCGVGGFLKKHTADEVATQTAIYTRKGCERCIRWAFEYTRKRNNPKGRMLTLVAKTNVLTYGHDLWWRTFQDVAKEYPDVKADYNHVDACCMWMVKNPEYFDVIVTTNMFGDIITDLGGILQGGMGVAAGGNINPDPGGTSMFEPMGGSAPKYTGQGVINPIAAINAVAMLLEQCGQSAAADRVNRAVAAVTGTKMKSQAAGKMGHSTSQIGDLVVAALV